ncbi:MAG: hypothetical protein RLZZ480_141 [Candidatus Parcubacteria bacterium]|jgi:chromosome segregation ATPase
MKFYLFAFVLLIGCVTFPVHAQTSTATSTESSGFLETVVENVSNLTENLTPSTPEPTNKAVLSPRAQERITNLAANISNRLEAIIARLQNITSRLHTRIEKLHDAQVDTSGANQSLEAAQTALDAARADLRGIDEKVLRVVGSTDPKNEWKNVRATFVSARDNIRTAHSELRNTVSQLKTLEAASPQQ